MVRGLDIFRDHFESQTAKYVLIGGTACYLAMREMGLDFRATRDLDIVLCAERIDADFSRVFWDFIQKGKYRNRQESTGKKLFYRFYDPGDVVYPHMIELFSRQPDALKIAEESHLTPIPFDDEASSLSAILLNEDYYSFILSGKQFVKGLPIVSAEFLIPLKARAYLDLIERQREGKLVNEKTFGNTKTMFSDCIRSSPRKAGCLYRNWWLSTCNVLLEKSYWKQSILKAWAFATQNSA